MTKRGIIFLGGASLGLLVLLLWWLLGNTGSGLSSLLPGGTFPSGTNSLPSDGASGQTGGDASLGGAATGSDGEIVPAIRQVSPNPVAGATSFLRGNTEVIRYIERGTGNVYETRADSLVTTRLSNMTVPRIQEALWFHNGGGVILRYLDSRTIKTFSATIATTSSGEGRLQGRFLPDDITALVVNPAGDRVFYLKDSSSGSIGALANPDGTGASAVFSSPLRDWLISWSAPNTILFTTKPTAGTRGFSYAFNPVARSFTPIISGFGLTATLSPDGKTTFYTSESGNGEMSALLSGATPAESPLTTYPEKCAWGSASLLYCGVPFDVLSPAALERWYRGENPFLDALWRLDTKAGTGTLETTFDGAENMDITSPSLTPRGTHLLFINKNDLTLWSIAVGA